MHPGAGQGHKTVGDCKVDDVVVGGSSHALVARHHDDDQDVAQDGQGDDGDVEESLEHDLPQRFDHDLLRVVHVRHVIQRWGRVAVCRVVAVHVHYC